jgi:hypothetical protein
LYLLGIAGAVLVGLVLGLERWLRIDERLAGRRRRKDE